MWTTCKFIEVVAVHCYFNRRRLLTPKAMAFKPPLLQCNSSMKKITKTINFLVWKITRNKYNNPKVLPKRLWEFNNLEYKLFCTTWLSCMQVAHNIFLFWKKNFMCVVFFFLQCTHLYVMMFFFFGCYFHRNGYHTSRQCLAICATIQDTVFTWK